jgi:hypothetical protein
MFNAECTSIPYIRNQSRVIRNILFLFFWQIITAGAIIAIKHQLSLKLEGVYGHAF